MTSSFRKGQLVAVKEPPATKWDLRVFERTAYANDPYCKEVIVRRPENAEGEGFSVCEQFVRPAEDVWTEISLRRDREKFEDCCGRIDWLCERLAEVARAHRFCPPNVWPGDCDYACWECWQQAVDQAMKEAKGE